MTLTTSTHSPAILRRHRARAQQWLLTAAAARSSIRTRSACCQLISRATPPTDPGIDYPGPPLAVLRPSTTAAVQAILRVAEAAGVTVVPRGAGTGLSGGASVPDGALVLSTERLNSIVRIDPDNEIAVVQAGSHHRRRWTPRRPNTA